MPQMHVFPTSFQTTDAVIIDRSAGRLLLGKKNREPLWRFVGGFVDPNDLTIELACLREVREEAGSSLIVDYPEYLFSVRIPDPRYANGPDKIMSAIFRCWYVGGKAKAGDDIGKVRWFTRDYIRRNVQKLIMPEHHAIVYGILERGLL